MSDMRESSTLPSSRRLTPEVYRQLLAGLADPSYTSEQAEEFRGYAARLVAMAARHLDRSKLEAREMWTRIEGALARAVAEAPNGDPGVLVSTILRHVLASASTTAADPEIWSLIQELSERPSAWRVGLVEYLRDANYAALVHGRALYQHRMTALTASASAETTEDAETTEGEDVQS